MASHLVVAMAIVGTTQFPPNNRYDANRWVAKIRGDVTGQDDWDPLVAPTSNRALTAGPAGYYSNSGTDVHLQIRFFKIENVKMAEGSMRVKVWWRMQWQDDRLAWNASQYGGVEEVFYNAEALTNSEVTEIWVPDLQPYNAVEGLVHTLEPALARVQASGLVYWSRPGSLEIMCKFSGLSKFPRDELICKTEVGGWILSGGQQGIDLLDGGFAFSSQEATSGASYQENNIINVTAELRNYVYPCCPSEPYPLVLYTIKLSRASGFYFFTIILPGILITCLSFAVFWSDTASADALGYGIGVIIVNLLSNFILIGVLPVCGEVIWVDLFAILNTVFCCISLFQSAFNIMVEQFEDDSLLPLWIHLPLARLYQIIRDAAAPKKKAAQVTEAPTQKTEATVARSKLASASVMYESVAGVIYRQEEGGANLGTSADTWRAKSAEALRVATRSERTEMLIFFESLFFTLDMDCTLYINWEECDLLLSYAALGLNPVARRKIFDEFDHTADGRLNRVEFVTMCSEMLSHVPIPQMNLAVKNMDVARNSSVRRAKAHWTLVATKLDSWSRIIIPFSYFFGLIIVFNIELYDDYATNDQATMINGLGPATFTREGYFLVVGYVVLMVVSGTMWLRVKPSAARNAKTLQEELKVASRESLHNFVDDKFGNKDTPRPGQAPAPAAENRARVYALDGK